MYYVASRSRDKISSRKLKRQRDERETSAFARSPVLLIFFLDNTAYVRQRCDVSRGLLAVTPLLSLRRLV